MFLTGRLRTNACESPHIQSSILFTRNVRSSYGKVTTLYIFFNNFSITCIYNTTTHPTYKDSPSKGSNNPLYKFIELILLHVVCSLKNSPTKILVVKMNLRKYCCKMKLIAELCMHAPSANVKFCLRNYEYGKSLQALHNRFEKLKGNCYAKQRFTSSCLMSIKLTKLLHISLCAASKTCCLRIAHFAMSVTELATPNSHS